MIETVFLAHYFEITQMLFAVFLLLRWNITGSVGNGLSVFRKRISSDAILGFSQLQGLAALRPNSKELVLVPDPVLANTSHWLSGAHWALPADLSPRVN